MPDRPLTLGELTELLDRFPLERAGDRTFDEVTDTQVQLHLARIAALTEMLRGATANETAQLASRMLLRDSDSCRRSFQGTHQRHPAFARRAACAAARVARPLPGAKR